MGVRVVLARRLGFVTEAAWSAGKRLFSGSDRDKLQLRLRESASSNNGVTKLVYDVER